jgi:tryptophan synthase alpha chain
MNGLEHIEQAFAAVEAEKRAALMPYFTLGFPTPEVSLEIVASIAYSGADLIELGIPFSDPLADGPTIQRSTQEALKNGMTLAGCLELTGRLRDRGVRQPLLFMGYYNPVLAYGLAQFVTDSAAAGVDGFIIPDLPPEEAGEMEAYCAQFGLALVYLLAPTSTTERITAISARARGFLYLVSLTGVTGARQALPADLQAFVERVRSHAKIPLAIGFGISTEEQARSVGRLADGVIVGSALINAVYASDRPVQAAGKFVRGLRDSLRRNEKATDG